MDGALIVPARVRWNPERNAVTFSIALERDDPIEFEYRLADGRLEVSMDGKVISRDCAALQPFMADTASRLQRGDFSALGAAGNWWLSRCREAIISCGATFH